ncbi:MAG: APC family permease [Solirubrobacteraceae bacterium]|nr:APC family permease [Solirubrobacteraceae bacterium]
MAERRLHSLQRVLGVNELFATAYGNVGSSIYYALGLVASYALGLTPLVFLITGAFFYATASSYAEQTAMYPEAGGSSSFARHAFGEYASFVAAWGQMLNFMITVATSAYFVPQYLGSLWAPLRDSPWNIIGAVIVVLVLMAINVVGTKESAKLNVGLAMLDFFTQVIIVIAGIFLLLDPQTLADNVAWGEAPTWGQFLLAIPIAMIAYTGIETVSNMAEEVKDEERAIPAAIKRVEIAVFAIYFTLPAVALSALPVTAGPDGVRTTQLGTPVEQGGFQTEPVLGVVRQMDLGFLNGPIIVYVGILAATILFLAANAGLIGMSRLVYSMGVHRQMPKRMSQLHPKFGTPWLGILVFGGLAIIPILPGKADFLGNLYAFGAMLSFTVAHLALLRLRVKNPDTRRPFRSGWNVKIRGYDIPMLAVFGLFGTSLAFVVVAARNLGGISYAGFAWLLIGVIAYPIARRRMGLDLSTTVKIDLPKAVVETETEYESVIVWFDAARFNEDTLATAARLAARRGRAITLVVTVQVPNSSPLDAEPPELHDQARAILDQARLLTRGRATGTIVPVRSGQEGRVIVDTAKRIRARAVIMGMPRGAANRSGFSRTLETVLAERPCRIIVDTPAPRAATGHESPVPEKEHNAAVRGER